MAVNTWDGASDTNWNDAANWNTTGVTDRVPTSADDVVIANVSNDPVIPDSLNPEIKSLLIESGGHLTCGANTITINGIASSWSVDVVSGGELVNSDCTFLFNSAADQKVRLLGTGNFHNVTVSKSDNDMVQGSNLTIEGDLSLTFATAHTWRPNSASHTLTVTGDVTIVEGKLGDVTNYTGAISFGSLTIESGGTYIATSGTTTITSETSGGVAVSNSGTFTHNSGTVEIQTPAATFTSPVNYNNLIINHASAAVKFTGSSGSTMTIAGNLTITQGSFENNISDANLTVTGYVDVTGTITGNSGAMSFGSLTINSGGTYNATSGTTTITNKNSSNYMFFDAGTFTHNNGTVHFKADTSSGTWYAVKGHSTEDTTEFYNVTTERVGSSVGNYRVCVGGSNQFFTVRNNLTIAANCKMFSSNGSSILRHSGLAIIDGELDLDSFTDIEMGAVTINSGGTLEFDNGSITIKAESLRNVGGTINA